MSIQRGALALAPLPSAGEVTSLQVALARALGTGRPSDADFLRSLAGLFSMHSISAGERLEWSGRPWQRVLISEEAILRLYRDSASGKRINHHFFRESEVVWPVLVPMRTSRNSFGLAAVEDGTLWSAPFEAFRQMTGVHGYWDRFARGLAEQLAEQALQREQDGQTLSALERYRKLCQEYPILCRRVPDYHLAAWIGVASATFSRLKHHPV
ncbi:MAG: Crp/Fnr family transcriptional regulator [Gammaproteobacteria bacterium]|nr:Crp/Fnr family transcriptional regulator [Gammaproteobacteria bacterium]